MCETGNREDGSRVTVESFMLLVSVHVQFLCSSTKYFSLLNTFTIQTRPKQGDFKDNLTVRSKLYNELILVIENDTRACVTRYSQGHKK